MPTSSTNNSVNLTFNANISTATLNAAVLPAVLQAGGKIVAAVISRTPVIHT